MVTINDSKLLQNINKWRYQSEYNRSFGDSRSSKQKKQPEVEEHVLSRYVKEDNRSIHSINKEKLASEDLGGKHHKKCKHNKQFRSSVKKKIQFSNDVLHKDLNVTKKDKAKSELIGKSDKTISNLSVNWNLKPVVAGKESEFYQRHPFIQKKKQIRVPNSDHFIYSGTADIRLTNKKLSRTNSEPALQTKKIVPYEKNHNILRTDLIEYKPPTENLTPVVRAFFEQQHESSQVDQLYIQNILSKYHKYKEQKSEDCYRSSYSLDYSPNVLTNKLIQADIESTRNENEQHGHKEKQNQSNFIYKKTYSPRNYETEYEIQFKEINKDKNVELHADQHGFTRYYKKVLNNRPRAYLSTSCDQLNEESPYKKIEHQEKLTEENEKTEHASIVSNCERKYDLETNVSEIKRKNKPKIKKNFSIASTSTPDHLKLYVNNKAVPLSSTCSDCSVCTYPSSYDPSLYSDET